ncbi:hypothetical protein SAMN05216489_08395 [Streptomyces sp. 3213]|uniref:hypothetical protein n=1 Tax=Streptomyces sp. 3213.3 TaxID=1855348 RepID=UPI000894C795|nr:hypothetical protein [Streptomyces sp. 3213.3]SEE80831.1 hypothetical protein SAMN05216489_08395 [Streptomyces sp. 3213] [Streptomyces sp. 3213.3]
MRENSTSGATVDFLLNLIDGGDAERVRRRIGLPQPEDDRSAEARRKVLMRSWTRTPVPASVLLWVLEENDPELNLSVWRHVSADNAMRRAIVRGVPFGPAGEGSLTVVGGLGREPEPPVPADFTRFGLVGALGEGTSMQAARTAASMVLERSDWQAVTEADRDRPLPGYARWALAIRPDCPPALRAQFGTHRKFTHRVEQAGVLDGPADYATSWTPASHVLNVLSTGHLLFPTRVGEAEKALRPLVRDHLADREDAWAVLAQLIDTFQGNAAELLVTAGAIA